MTDRRRGEVFDDVAEAYDEVRRGYPASLVDAALARGALGPGSGVVEVGCGTGKLTELLVARGLDIDAVDPGMRMIEMARRRVGASELVRFHHGRFEEVELPGGSFDGVFSATAFHWVDPTVGWRKAAGHLVPGGLLALLCHRDAGDETSAEVNAGFRELWRRYLKDEPEWPPQRDADTILAEARDRHANVSEVWDYISDGRHGLAVPDAAEVFEDVSVEGEVESVEEDADHAVALLRTTSSYFRIHEARRPEFEADVHRLYDRLGGTVRFSLMTVLVTARAR